MTEPSQRKEKPTLWYVPVCGQGRISRTRQTWGTWWSRRCPTRESSSGSRTARSARSVTRTLRTSRLLCLSEHRTNVTAEIVARLNMLVKSLLRTCKVNFQTRIADIRRSSTCARNNAHTFEWLRHARNVLALLVLVQPKLMALGRQQQRGGRSSLWKFWAIRALDEVNRRLYETFFKEVKLLIALN